MDFPESQKAVRAMSVKWPLALIKLVEDKANGPAIIASLRDEIAGLIAVEPDGGKEARAHAVSPMCESGNVFLPHPNLYPWVTTYCHEMQTFPNSANDDDVDSTTQALKRWLVAVRMSSNKV
jgi:predicted phage terminase large subunit-like protein